jgi:hypothetical protein
VLLERFDQTFDGLLPLRQIALGCLLKLPERLLRQPQKFRCRLLQRVCAQRLERVAQIFQRLRLQFALLGQQFFRRTLFGLRRRAGVAGVRQLRTKLCQFRLALPDLIAQFIFQSCVGTTAAPEQPADENSQRTAGEKRKEKLDSERHGQKCAMTSISTLEPLGSAAI